MDDVPELSSDEDAYDDDDEWQEMETSDESFRCLFCKIEFTEVEKALEHCYEVHKFDLELLKRKHGMNFYSYIKMINYIRSNKSDAISIMSAALPLWRDDMYMIPVRSDGWLMFDFDSFKETVPVDRPAFHANVENGLVTLSEAHFSELQRTTQSLTAQIKERDNLLALASADINKMKETMRNLVNSGGDLEQTACNAVDNVSKISLRDDSNYFNSYAHFGIHYEMLTDKVRTESYKQAILQNSSVLRDKVILDLGCGTGILSMFAANAEAKIVYAIDQSEIVYQALDIIRENNLQDKIIVTKGKLENTKLPTKVDVIISEWMGYFLLFEGMLDSVIYARNEYLNPNGLLLPNRCDISIVGSGDINTHNKLINFWSDVYGFKMNCMKSEVTKEATLDIVPSDEILTTSCKVTEIDINTCTTDVMNFSSNFTLRALRDGSLTSLVGYFDTYFDLPFSVSFSTSPQSKPTHWKQTVFYFKNYFDVRKDDVINGVITVKRDSKDARALTVDIEIFGKTYNFILS